MVSVVAQISKYRNNNTYLWHGGVVLVRTVVVVGMMGAFQQRGTVSKEERGKCNYWLERLHKKKRRLIEMSATTTT